VAKNTVVKLIASHAAMVAICGVDEIVALLEAR
jgi:hypothetical protein